MRRAGGSRTGAYGSWFGGANTTEEAASLQQTGIIAPGPKALNFYLRWVSPVTSPPDPAATFTVKMDGNPIFSLTPATAAAYHGNYTLATVDIPAYADGNPHTRHAARKPAHLSAHGTMRKEPSGCSSRVPPLATSISTSPLFTGQKRAGAPGKARRRCSDQQPDLSRLPVCTRPRLTIWSSRREGRKPGPHSRMPRWL